MNKIKLYTSLAYLGALPFVICAVLVSADVQDLFLLGNVVTLGNTYGLVIVVFMAGVHWGTYLCDQRSHSLNLLLASNIITVFCWLAHLLLPAMLALGFYALAFFLLLLIDFKLLHINVITKHYFLTRCVVTSIVITSLLIIIMSLFA